MWSRRPNLAPAVALLAALTGCDRALDPPPAVPTCAAAPEASAPLADGLVGVSERPPTPSAPPAFDDADPSAVRLFYDVLARYGQWREDPRLGLVWAPAAPEAPAPFVPYATQGHWTVSAPRSSSEFEYVWVSDLPWGWVVFHYGRWAYAGEQGWAWVPGRRYASSWVDWRSPAPTASGGAPVVGWGPTPPARIWRLVAGTHRPGASLAEDVRLGLLTTEPYAAFATPYVYARATELFASDLEARLLEGDALLRNARFTRPSAAPVPATLGVHAEDLPSPPALDHGLLQAWALATPATAAAVGAGPELGPPPRLGTWVAGGPRWSRPRSTSASILR